MFSLAFDAVSVLWCSRGIVVNYSCFNLYVMWFHMLIYHLYVSFGEISVKIFGPFCNWVVCVLIEF